MAFSAHCAVPAGCPHVESAPSRTAPPCVPFLTSRAGMFAKAQAMYKEGNAPRAVGIADDLPNRFAYQQLKQLAGMAAKVQDAIKHNENVFRVRVQMEDQSLKRRVREGPWRLGWPDPRGSQGSAYRSCKRTSICTKPLVHRAGACCILLLPKGSSRHSLAASHQVTVDLGVGV